MEYKQTNFFLQDNWYVILLTWELFNSVFIKKISKEKFVDEPYRFFSVNEVVPLQWKNQNWKLQFILQVSKIDPGLYNTQTKI